MDDSVKRRGHDCWFRRPEVGLVAINDGFLLQSHIYRILKKYFAAKGGSVYLQLIELFNEVRTRGCGGVWGGRGDEDFCAPFMRVHYFRSRTRLSLASCSTLPPSRRERPSRSSTCSPRRGQWNSGWK